MLPVFLSILSKRAIGRVRGQEVFSNTSDLKKEKERKKEKHLSTLVRSP
jgi:hypothetical protein